MAKIFLITTGEQAPTVVGAIAGVLDTSGLTAGYGTLHVRVRGLANSASCRIEIEDTVNATPFTSDATQPWSFDFVGAPLADGVTVSSELFKLPDMRFGVTLSKLRANMQAMSTGATPLITAWISQ